MQVTHHNAAELASLFIMRIVHGTISTGLDMNKYFLTILIIICAGCASLAAKEKLGSLELSTDKYENAVRWGYFEMADGFRNGSDKDMQSTDFSELKKIRVTSYEILNRTISEDYLKATQYVEIKYYYIDQMIEKTILDKQIWKYDDDRKTWFLHGDLPHFTQEHN